MLSADDAALAGRDTAITDLALLLDDDALTAAIDRAHPSAGMRGARVGYLRYKPHTSCIAAVDVDWAAGPATVAVRTHDAADVGKVDKILDRARRRPAPDVGPPLAFGTRSVLTHIPHDRRLRAARALGRGRDREQALLTRLLPEGLVEGTSLTHLRYKPERRWVARIDGPEGPRGILKCFADPGYEPAAGAAKRLPDTSGAPLLQRLGASDRYRAAAYPFLPGVPLSQLLHRGRHDDLLRRTGAALAALHAADPAGLRTAATGADAAAVGGAATSLLELLPQHGDRIARLAARIGSALAALPTVRGPRHGDFSADQVLVDGDAVTIIDLDRADAGDPVADLGLFAATSLRVAASGPLTAAAARSQAATLVDGYVDAGGADPAATLDVWTAAWLMRLAAEPFRYREDDWSARGEAMLELAAGMLR